MEQEQQDNPNEPETRKPGEDGWEPPKDGSWMPTWRRDKDVNIAKDRATELEIELSKEREVRIRLEERITAGEKKQGESTEVTRSQLAQQVSDGNLTQNQSDDIWMAQEKKAWKTEMQQEISQQRDDDQRNRQIDDQLAAYTRACPEVNEQGTDERKKVTREFNELVRMGQPSTPSTELLALRAVFGPADKLTELRSKRAAHSETGSGTGGEGQPASANLSGRQERQKRYYDKLVERGIITKEDAEKDLKHASGA